MMKLTQSHRETVADCLDSFERVNCSGCYFWQECERLTCIKIGEELANWESAQRGGR